MGSDIWITARSFPKRVHPLSTRPESGARNLTCNKCADRLLRRAVWLNLLRPLSLSRSVSQRWPVATLPANGVSCLVVNTLLLAAIIINQSEMATWWLYALFMNRACGSCHGESLFYGVSSNWNYAANWFNVMWEYSRYRPFEDNFVERRQGYIVLMDIFRLRSRQFWRN